MLDIKFLRSNPELVKENIRKKFQEEKVALVDEVIELDEKCRAARTRCEYLRSQRNTISKQIGAFMAKGQREEAEQAKKSVSDMAEEMSRLDAEVNELSAQIRERMLVIPNIIDPTVPIGRDDSENVELERFGEPRVPEYEVPYHVEIMERFSGIDLDSARKTSGNGFYYLKGDVARLHSAILSYARDFMIDKGFEYYVPPFMIRSGVVDGVIFNAEKFQRWSDEMNNEGFDPNDDLGYHYMKGGILPTISSNDEYRTGDALMARLFYSYDNRYMITGTVRRDGYSAFGQKNPRAVFPSVAVCWVFSDEPFLKKLNWLDYGKLRFSWVFCGARSVGHSSGFLVHGR